MVKIIASIVALVILTSSFALANQPDKVELRVSPGCMACDEAKSILNANNIKFTVAPATSGKYVPQLYVNGKFVGYGVGSVIKYIKDIKQ